MVRIVLHSGVADYVPTHTEEIRIAQAMKTAMERGERILQKGGTAIDAVEASITFMEDCGLFNAGRGAVKSEAGTVELDAAIMNGETGEWGAIGSARGIKNPIQVARNVMDKEQQLLIVGPCASNYVTSDNGSLEDRKNPIIFNLGTVGCVALDAYGNLASGISSGGAFDKRSGRLGGACIIGTEISCRNETCGVSCSGIGEEFIKNSTAAAIHYAMKFAQMSLKEACQLALRIMPPESAGIIALDRRGNVVVAHNCKRFYTIHNKVGSNLKAASKRTFL